MSKDCKECDGLPNEARAVRDLYDTKEYYRIKCIELEKRYKEILKLID